MDDNYVCEIPDVVSLADKSTSFGLGRSHVFASATLMSFPLLIETHNRALPLQM